MTTAPALSTIDLAVISLHSAVDSARQSHQRLSLPSTTVLSTAASNAARSLEQAVEVLVSGQDLDDIEQALIGANSAAQSLQHIVLSSKSTQGDRALALAGIKSASRAAGLLEALR